MSFFRNLWLKIIAFFRTSWGQAVLAAGQSVVAELGKKGTDLLAKEAQARALELEEKYPNGSGDLKHKELVDFLRLRATDLGLNLGDSVVNVLVEIAVSALKGMGKLGVDAPVPPAV
ncbi:MAG: hypothetical protein V3S69_01695 [Dehalococcoidales bacterium]